MANIRFTRADGAVSEVKARSGLSLMEVAIAGGVDGIVGECGGGCSCATCHVFVSPEWLDKIEPATDYERELLDALDDTRPTSRLSCQLRVSANMEGMEVEIPANQGF